MARLCTIGALLALASTSILVNADGIYNKNSPVVQVNAKSYDLLIAQSNHTSVSSDIL